MPDHPRLFGKFELILACSVIISAIFISFFLPSPSHKPPISPISLISQIFPSPAPTPMDGSQYVAQHLPPAEGKPLPDWITYRNEEYGFTLKYPENLNLDDKNRYQIQNQILNISDNMDNYLLDTKIRLDVYVTSNNNPSYYHNPGDIEALNEIGFSELQKKFGDRTYGNFTDNTDSNAVPDYQYNIQIPQTKGRSFNFNIKIPENITTKQTKEIASHILSSFEFIPDFSTIKTYTSKVYDFSVGYPREWYFQESSYAHVKVTFNPTSCDKNCSTISISVYDNPQQSSPADWWNDTQKIFFNYADILNKTTRKSFTINNNPAYQIFYPAEPEYNISPSTQTLIAKDSYIYEISSLFGSENPAFSIYQQLITSFKI